MAHSFKRAADSAIRSKEIRSNELSVLETNRELIEELKRIPFLELDLNFNLDKVREESGQITSWFPHLLEKKKQLPDWYYQKHAESFRGRCVFDIVEDSSYGMVDPPFQLHQDQRATFDEKGRVQYYETDIGKKMPYTTQVLRKISTYVNRTRIIKSKPGAEVQWHSHHNNVYKSPYLRLAIFNIPIFSTPDATHCVRDFRDKNSKVYEMNLKPGKVYLFNSWHDHLFVNRGGGDRVALCPYYNFLDQELLDLLKPHVLNYNGPYISK